MKSKLGTKPIFEGQRASCPRGCFYPYATRIGDDSFGNRLCYCVNHGFFIHEVKYYKSLEEAMRCRKGGKIFPPRKRTLLMPIPTMAWRRKEEKRMKVSR